MELIRKVISTYVKLTMKYIYREKYKFGPSLPIRRTVPSSTSLLQTSTFPWRPPTKVYKISAPLSTGSSRYGTSATE